MLPLERERERERGEEGGRGEGKEEGGRERERMGERWYYFAFLPAMSEKACFPKLTISI